MQSTEGHPHSVTLIKHIDEDKTNTSTSENDRKLEEIANLKVFTDSQAIYRISPVLATNTSTGFVYPKIKVDNLDEAIAYSREIDTTTDYNVTKTKFELRDALSAYNSEAVSHLEIDCESNYLDAVEPNFDLNSVITKVQRPENEDDPRKNLDKYNLFKAYTYASDPLNTKTHFKHDGNYENCEVEFFSVDTQIKDLLDINL